MESQGKRVQLGRKIAEFRSYPINIKTWLLVVLPAGLLILFCFAYGILLGGNTFQQHGPALALLRARSWLILGSVVLVLLAIYIFFAILLSLQRLEVFSRGLTYRNSLLQKRAYLWSDLIGITSSATKSTIFGKNLRTIPKGRIYPKNGRPIDLSTRIEGIPKLIKIIKSNLYPLLWPEMKTSFLNGEILQFGRISINKDYISIANKNTPWNNVRKIWVDSGYLIVELHQASSGRVPISQILNLELLLKVVDWGFQT